MYNKLIDINFSHQIIQLVEDSYPSPRPCLKLRLTSTTSSTDKKVKHFFINLVLVIYSVQVMATYVQHRFNLLL